MQISKISTVSLRLFSIPSFGGDFGENQKYLSWNWTKYGRLVLGCMDADFRKQVFVGKSLSKFIIFTIVISFYTSPIAKIQQNWSLLGAHFQISKCNMFGLISNCTASSRIPLNLLTSEISQNFELNFPRIVKECRKLLQLLEMSWCQKYAEFLQRNSSKVLKSLLQKEDHSKVPSKLRALRGSLRGRTLSRPCRAPRTAPRPRPAPWPPGSPWGASGSAPPRHHSQKIKGTVLWPTSVSQILN